MEWGHPGSQDNAAKKTQWWEESGESGYGQTATSVMGPRPGPQEASWHNIQQERLEAWRPLPLGDSQAGQFLPHLCPGPLQSAAPTPISHPCLSLSLLVWGWSQGTAVDRA